MSYNYKKNKDRKRKGSLALPNLLFFYHCSTVYVLAENLSERNASNLRFVARDGHFDQNLQEKIGKSYVFHASERFLRCNATVEASCESLQH